MQTVAGLHHDDFNHAAEAAARAFYRKPIGEITFIEHGADNLILLVNREFVFRFPRDENAGARLYFETALLQKLAGRITAVAIPQVVHISHYPLFVVSNYIEGEHLSGPQIQSLSEVEQQAVGAKISQFMVEINNVISGLEVQRLRTEANLNRVSLPWEPYFKQVFEMTPLPDERLRPIVQQYYPLWKDYVAHEQRTFAIHDDLHPVNILFSGPRLSGMLDFGDTNIGGAEEEMRWLYLMGDIVVQSAIAEYARLTNTQLSYEHIKVWAIMHELSTFVSRLVAKDVESFPFQRSRAHLKQWVPNFPV